MQTENGLAMALPPFLTSKTLILVFALLSRELLTLKMHVRQVQSFHRSRGCMLATGHFAYVVSWLDSG